MSVIVRHGDNTQSKVQKATDLLAEHGAVSITNYEGHSCQKAIAVVEQVKVKAGEPVRQANKLSRFDSGSVKLEVVLSSIQKD